MIFSAGNATFYNYCQLLVKGNAHMYDGEFNLMENSYTEAATSEMDNFIVNMGDGASYYVKGDTKIEAQGDGTFQGFRNTNSGKGAVVKLGGTVTIASHKHSLMVDAGITYAINNVQIIKKGNVVTEDYLQSIGDGDYPVEVYDGVEANFDKTTVTANYLDCGGSTSVKPGEKTPSVWTYAFEDNTLKGDYDMNDVVLKVSYVDAKTMSQLKIELVAAGCEFDNEVYLDETPIMFANKRDGGETNEVHAAFGVAKGKLVNTGGRSTSAEAVYTIIDTPAGFEFPTAKFNIVPSGGENKDQHIHIAQEGAPYGIAVPINWKYPVENRNIGSVYEEEGHSFGEWATDASHQTAADWYNYPTGDVVSK
jgi:hypothetical protein